VLQGWPALYDSTPLAQGTTLIEAAFDNKKLLATAKRLKASDVDVAVWRWQAKPPEGSFLGAIFPHEGRVVETAVDEETFRSLEAAVGRRAATLPMEVCATAEEIGLVQEGSFLCCPRSDESGGRVEEAISTLIEPQPH
jgi:hypothetical protein